VPMIVSEGRRVEKARKCQLSPTIVPDDSEVMAKGRWAGESPWLVRESGLLRTGLLFSLKGVSTAP
jgi:hypothetical protein